MALEINYKHIPWLLTLVGIVLYVPFIGSVNLFDWDEINFAECAREMIVSSDFLRVQIDFQDFHQKPPLFIWMQVLSMKLFGINEFAARFPNALAGIINLLLLYFIGKEIRNKKFGLIWAFVHGLSFLPFLYFKSGIIDPWFNMFIFGGIIAFLFGVERSNKIWTISSGILIGLAVLTKGPVGLLIFGGSIFLAIFSKRLWRLLSWSQILYFLVPFILVGGFWFIMVALNGRAEIIWGFIDYQIRLFSTPDAGHGGPFYYHFIVLLIGCFPSSAYALPKLFERKQDFFETAIMWSLIFTLLLFSIVETKIIHYSSFCYYAMSFFAASYLSSGERRKWVHITNLVILVIWILLFANIAILGNSLESIDLANLIKDKFALANLQAQVNWGSTDFLPAIALFVALLLFIAKRNQLALWLTTSLAIYSFLVIIVPKIEAYSQRSAIEYFKSIQNEKADIYTYAYKSYAHLFYSRKQMLDQSEKKHFLVTKIQKKNQLREEFPNAILKSSTNGYLLFELAQ